MQDVNSFFSADVLSKICRLFLPLLIVVVKPPVALVPAHLPHSFCHRQKMEVHSLPLFQGRRRSLNPVAELTLRDNMQLAIPCQLHTPVPSYTQLTAHPWAASVCTHKNLQRQTGSSVSQGNLSKETDFPLVMQSFGYIFHLRC